MKKRIELPKGWNKINAKTVEHETGVAKVCLKTARADYQHNARKFLVWANGGWVLNYMIFGYGQWIAEFDSLLEAINVAERFLK